MSAAISAGVPLALPEQKRNQWIYAGIFWLTYLAAPVTYLGSTQPALCKELGASVTVANMPLTLYFAFSFMPLILAWWSPFVRSLKRNTVLCFATNTVAMGLVAIALVSPISNEAKIAAVLLQSAVAGIVMPAAGGVFLWEALARGVDESRRGATLSLTFGFGPILAVVGSIVQQGVLPDDPAKRWFPALVFPYNFALLYALCTPLCGLNALLAARLIIPLPERERPREPFLEGVFGGVRNYARDRVLLLAFLAAVLVYTGNLIPSNMTLYTQFAIGGQPSDWAGYGSIFRFGFKAVVGLFLGWLLSKTNAKIGFLATAAFFIAGQVWGTFATGFGFLIAFGLYGAGELIGVYAPNYILSASRHADIRRNMALATLVAVPTAPFGLLFGWITDRFNTYLSAGAGAGPIASYLDAAQGQGTIGFRLSFIAAAATMGLGFLLMLFALPARPQPKEDATRNPV